ALTHLGVGRYAGVGWIVDQDDAGHALPNPHALGGRQIELLTGPYVEGVVPGVEVTDGQGPIFARRVDVGEQRAPQRRLAVLRAVVLRPAQKEPLVAGETVQHRRGATAERQLPGVVGDGQPR